MSLILIVDDVAAMCEQYAYDLERLGGYETITAGGGAEALDVIRAEPVDCLILDLEMPGMDGFAVLKALRQMKGEAPPVIVYTGTGNFARCVRAIKLGAFTFVDKSEPMERVVQEIENALEQHRLSSEVKALKNRLGEDSPMIGESRPMMKLREAIARLAPIPSAVLIMGESGSGKELVARELHRLSPRASQLFLPLNCAALPENLVESELFGHEAGAFTGASRLRRGAFEAANGGTLFLDEVGELPVPAQAKLLRVLEDQQVTRLGGSRQIKVDTRVVTATNRDLEAEIAAGRFRQDLHFRLNVHILTVPPLRERLSDVPPLLEHFLGETCRRFGYRPKRIAAEAIGLLQACEWRKNNVRELRNAIERMVIACDGDEIGAEHVPAEAVRTSAAEGEVQTLKESKARAEREIVVAALERNDWQITKTAAELGLADHSSLLKIMRRHKLARR